MQWEFWQDFARVEVDRVILTGLLVFLIVHHAETWMIAGTFGALIRSIEGQRYARTPGKPAAPTGGGNANPETR